MTQSEPFVFFHQEIFYTIEIPRDRIAANVALNQGIIRVEDTMGNVIWERQKESRAMTPLIEEVAKELARPRTGYGARSLEDDILAAFDRIRAEGEAAGQVDRAIDLGQRTALSAFAVKDAEIAALREAIEQMRNTVRLHANAIETEVNLISRAALEKSGG
jgi:hypothetical protein